MSAWVSGFREVRRDTRSRGGSSHRLLSATAIVVLLIFGASQLHNLLPSLHNPFATKTVDRSGPVLLKSLTDLHTYDAAQANLTEFVDLKKETAYVPSILMGKETQFLAVGSVQAGVDFSNLDTSSMVLSKDHHSVAITLPHARLGDVTVDPDQSRVVSQQKGLFDRVGSLFGSSGSDAALYQLAKAKIAAAAAGDPTILAQAEKNTRSMLGTLLASLGYTSVSVSYA
ncbi:MAG: hypothetical protein QOE76_2026 [Frankiales bacterium]|jgi:hypothetical protein|nr:hypothetical protein [Frankiales bacterium]